MKLTNLLSELFTNSKYENIAKLAEATGQTPPFTAAFIEGKKEARRKEDILFGALTEGVTVKQFMAALELIRQVKLAEIENEQIL